FSLAAWFDGNDGGHAFVCKDFFVLRHHGSGVLGWKSLHRVYRAFSIPSPAGCFCRAAHRRNRAVPCARVDFPLPRDRGSLRNCDPPPDRRRGRRVRGGMMEVTAAISSFLTHIRVEKGLSANTVSAYRRDLMKFSDFAQKRKLSLVAVSRDDLVDFLAGLYRQRLER